MDFAQGRNGSAYACGSTSTYIVRLTLNNCRAKELVKPPELHMTTSLLSAVVELFLLYIKTTTRPNSRWGSHTIRDNFYNLALAPSSFGDGITICLKIGIHKSWLGLPLR